MSFAGQGLGQVQPHGCQDGSMAGPHEVYVVQFLHPHGERQVMRVPVGEEVADAAKRINAGLSAEVLSDGNVAIYGMLEDMAEDDEFIMFAANGPGEDEPTEVVRRMVAKLATVADGA